MWSKFSCMRKTTRVQWQGPGLEKPIFKSEVQRAILYTIAPLQ